MVIKNLIAEHGEFIAVESADVAGFVDFLQQHDDGRQEVMFCLGKEDVRDAAEAQRYLQAFRGGFLKGQKASREGVL